jgi:hypothetical protein
MARKRIDELDALAVTDVAVGDLGVLYDLSAAKAKKLPYYATTNPWLWPRQNYTGDQTLVAGDMWKVIGNTGVAANRTFTLPAGATEYAVLFHNDSDTYTLRIDPNGSEIIGAGGAGKYLEMLERGWILLAFKGGKWEPIFSYGVEQYEP